MDLFLAGGITGNICKQWKLLASKIIEECKSISQEKREVVQRFAEIILMNDEGNTMPAHQIAAKAVEVYNKIEDYL